MLHQIAMQKAHHNLQTVPDLVPHNELFKPRENSYMPTKVIEMSGFGANLRSPAHESANVKSLNDINQHKIL